MTRPCRFRRHSVKEIIKVYCESSNKFYAKPPYRETSCNLTDIAPKSLIFMRIYEVTDFPWHFLAILYKIEAYALINCRRVAVCELFCRRLAYNSNKRVCEQAYRLCRLLFEMKKHKHLVIKLVR